MTTATTDLEFLEEYRDIEALYELRKTLEIHAHGKSFRIEIWYWHSNPKCGWTARVHMRSEEPGSFWRELEEFPWVQERDASTAIHNAIIFLEDRKEWKRRD